MSEALDKLIEAVDAGRGDAASIFTKRLSSAARDRGAYWPSHDVENAFSGSLDAALALHKALLPGWGAKIEMQTPVDVQISFAWVGPREEMLFRQHSSSMHCPARALLLAILRAYRQQRGSGE